MGRQIIIKKNLNQDYLRKKENKSLLLTIFLSQLK